MSPPQPAPAATMQPASTDAAPPRRRLTRAQAKAVLGSARWKYATKSGEQTGMKCLGHFFKMREAQRRRDAQRRGDPQHRDGATKGPEYVPKANHSGTAIAIAIVELRRDKMRPSPFAAKGARVAARAQTAGRGPNHPLLVELRRAERARDAKARAAAKADAAAKAAKARAATQQAAASGSTAATTTPSTQQASAAPTPAAATSPASTTTTPPTPTATQPTAQPAPTTPTAPGPSLRPAQPAATVGPATTTAQPTARDPSTAHEQPVAPCLPGQPAAASGATTAATQAAMHPAPATPTPSQPAVASDPTAATAQPAALATATTPAQPAPSVAPTINGAPATPMALVKTDESRVTLRRKALWTSVLKTCKLPDGVKSEDVDIITEVAKRPMGGPPRVRKNNAPQFRQGPPQHLAYARPPLAPSAPADADMDVDETTPDATVPLQPLNGAKRAREEDDCAAGAPPAKRPGLSQR